MRKILRFMFILLASTTACIAAIHFSSIAYCEQRKMIPTVIVYPGSILVKKSTDMVRKDYSLLFFEIYEPPNSIATFYYHSADTADKVFQFYREHGAQLSGATGQNLRGNASPFGEYFIYGDWKSKTQSSDYAIEFWWRPCR